MVRKTSHSKPITRIALLSAIAFLFLLPGAAAQTASLDMTVPAEPVEAMPLGDPAKLNVTVAYSCGTTLPVADITLAAAIKNDAGGSAALGTQAITPATVPDCTPGDTETEMVELAFTPAVDQIAGTKVEVDVTATYDPSGQGQGETATKTATFLVGPYVEVTFAPNVTTIDAVAGQEIPIGVAIESKSNTLVMAMPSVDGVPATWERPDVLPKNVPSPLEDGETGQATLQFLVKVPADASGTVTMDLSLYAHSLTDTYMETEKTTFPITVNVAPGTTTTASGGDDAEESPAFPVTALVLAGVALLALARRR